MAAEKNFNPFAQTIPTICSDAGLPATEALRGIVPLVDPAVTGSGTENANSATSLKTPFDGTGLSVADVMAANGFSNFTTQGADGKAGAAPAAGNGQGNAAGNGNTAAATTATAAATAAVTDCAGAVTKTVTAAGAAATTTTAAAAAATTAAAAVSGGAAKKSTVAGLDFGACEPTLKFEVSPEP